MKEEAGGWEAVKSTKQEEGQQEMKLREFKEEEAQAICSHLSENLSGAEHSPGTGMRQ
jgi:hypothetical protein